MNNYQKRKAQVREKYITWQQEFSKNCYSWGDLADISAYFERLAKRYGLVCEFMENGII